jgi:hypothetical protein
MIFGKMLLKSHFSQILLQDGHRKNGKDHVDVVYDGEVLRINATSGNEFHC